MMNIKKLENIPANSNPFHHEAFLMGTYVASNVLVMHPTHPDEAASYVVIVNKTTGERIKVTFGEGNLGGKLREVA